MASQSKSFARALAEGRDRLGCTQAILAEKLDVSTRSVIQWENGDREPREAMRIGILALIERFITEKESASC